MPAIPTATAWDSPSRVVARQTTITVTSVPVATSAGLSGGAIAGIVVGSVVGFFLLVWVMWSCMRLGASPSRGGVGDGCPPERCRSVSPHHYTTTTRPHHKRRRRHPSREVREYRTSTPVVVDRRRSVSVSSPQRVYTRSRSRGPVGY